MRGNSCFFLGFISKVNSSFLYYRFSILRRFMIDSSRRFKRNPLFYFILFFSSSFILARILSHNKYSPSPPNSKSTQNMRALEQPGQRGRGVAFHALSMGRPRNLNFLQPVQVYDPFQAHEVGIYKGLCRRPRLAGCIYIFHVMDYFSPVLNDLFPSETANVENVVPTIPLVKFFARYTRPWGIYCDRGHHFQNNFLVKDYLFRTKNHAHL